MHRLHTLGSLELSDGSGEEVREVLSQPKRVALLAYMAMAAPGGYLRRDTVLAMFWPELDEERARGALNQALYFLRRALGPETLVTRGREEIGIDPRRLWCDAVAVEEALTLDSPDALRGAVDAFRGDLLPGFHLGDAPAFVGWLEDRRASLRRQVADAAWDLASRADREDRPVEGSVLARRAVEISPFDEVRLRGAMDLFVRAGDRPGAIRLFNETADRLRREYEWDLSEETTSHAESLGNGGEVPRGRPDATSVPRRLPPLTVDASASGARPGSRSLRMAPVVALTSLVTLLVLAMWAGRPGSGDGGVGGAGGILDPNRVAVLPLATVGGGEEGEFLAEGLTVELISRLSRLRDLRVLPLSSVLSPRDSAGVDERKASELLAGTIVDGRVRAVGGTFRVTVLIHDANADETVWSRDYDVDGRDLRVIERDVAEEVARALKIEGRAAETDRVAGDVADPRAYAHYLRGRALLGRLDPASLRGAREQFQAAVKGDPRFALAWSGLANAHLQLISNGTARGPEAARTALEAAQRAVKLDEELPEAYATMAVLQSHAFWDSDAAERNFRRAIDLDPSSTDVLRGYATHLRNLGRFEEARVLLQRVRELDPNSNVAALEEGIVLYMSGQYDAALGIAGQVLTRDPEARRAWFLTALCRVEQGRYGQALEILDRLEEPGGPPDAASVRAYVFARTGREGEARAILRDLRSGPEGETAFVYNQALIHVALGEQDRAVALLEDAARQGVWLVRIIGVEPKFRSLQGHAGFQALLDRLGLRSGSVAPG